MKFETILKRYKNLGYQPKGLEQYLEVESIIKWLYDTHDIYINLIYCHMKFEHYKKFTGSKICNTKEDFNNTFYCDKHFTNPFDAKLDAIISAYSSVKFLLYDCSSRPPYKLSRKS